MCVSKAREWPGGWQIPGPRAVQHLQMPHPWYWQGGQMPRSYPGGGGGAGRRWNWLMHKWPAAFTDNFFTFWGCLLTRAFTVFNRISVKGRRAIHIVLPIFVCPSPPSPPLPQVYWFGNHAPVGIWYLTHNSLAGCLKRLFAVLHNLPYWKKLGNLSTFVPKNVLDGAGGIGSWPTLNWNTKKGNGKLP